MKLPHLSNAAIEGGKGFFKSQNREKLMKGYKRKHVAAACLYLACRTEKEVVAYLLIDFSDAINASVFDLGRVYVKLK